MQQGYPVNDVISNPFQSPFQQCKSCLERVHLQLPPPQELCLKHRQPT